MVEALRRAETPVITGGLPVALRERPPRTPLVAGSPEQPRKGCEEGIKKLIIELLTMAALGAASAAVAGSNGRVKPVVDVQMNCNTMVGVFEVAPAAARAALPAKYELALQPNGNAVVYLQASNCDGAGCVAAPAGAGHGAKDQ